MHERGFNSKSVCENKGEKIPGRNIAERALIVVANFKFALKFSNEYLVNGNLPSGKTFEDLCLYVREQMFVKFKGGKNSMSKHKNEVTVSDMPTQICVSWLLFLCTFQSIRTVQHDLFLFVCRW